jgi:hypothetical protein
MIRFSGNITESAMRNSRGLVSQDVPPMPRILPR